MTPPHPGREADASVIEAAGKLTKAQRASITVRAKWCVNHVSLLAEWHTFQRGPLHRRLCDADLIFRCGRLTPLGLAVRAHLANQAGSE